MPSGTCYYARCRGRWRARCWPLSARSSRMPAAAAPSRTTWPKASPLRPTSAPQRSLRSAETFRPRTRCAVSWKRRRVTGAPSWSSPPSPACALRSCAGCAGPMSISLAARCTSASVPTPGGVLGTEDPHRAARGSGRAVRGQRAQGMEAGLPKGRARSGVPRPRWRPVGAKTTQHAGYWPAQRAADVVTAKGKPNIPGFTPCALFRQLVHQSAPGRRLGTAAEDGTAAAWPLDDRHDRRHYGHLFPPGDDSAELAAAEQALLRPVGDPLGGSRLD